MVKKLKENQKGFTLTEVMIGIMILTVAIVSASNLLVGLVNTNEKNLSTLQAHYYAIEGLEAVRNIRDTNWLHNKSWLGEGSRDLWQGSFAEGQYSVVMEGAAFNQGADAGSFVFRELGTSRPWTIVAVPGEEIKNVEGENTGFRRTIGISAYQEGAVLVTSTVDWDLGSKRPSLSVSEILTNWKDGAL